MKTIEVAAAVIFREDKILCVQRPEHAKSYISKKWEFPGGKIEKGESAQEALVREIREELSEEIQVSEFLMTVEHAYPDFHLTMHVFTCTLQSREMVLNEHMDSKWLPVAQLYTLDWAAADLPVVKRLLELN